MLKRAIAILIGTLLLSSCASMNSGVKIGDKEFSTNDIQKPVDELLNARKKIDITEMKLPVGVELLRNQAQFLILSVLLDYIAENKNITVTNADIAARRSEIISQVGGEAELPKALVGASLAPSNLDAYLKILIISEQLSKDVIASGFSSGQVALEVDKLVVAAAKNLGVEVNPKYGKWNPVTTAIDANDSTDGAVTPLP